MRIQNLAQVPAEERREQLGTGVDLPAESRLAAVKPLPHAGVLRPLAREQEGDRTAVRGAAGGDQGLRLASRQGPPRARDVAADQGPAPGEGTAAGLERPGDVGQVRVRARRQPAGQVLGRHGERRRGAGRQQQELPGPGRPRGRGLRRLLDHEVSVGPPQPEGADSGPARHAVGVPLAEGRVDVEGARSEIDRRIGCLEPQARGDLPVLERENGLDQAGDPRGRPQVTDIGLDRSQGAKAGPPRPGAEGAGQRRHLDRIAERSARAVSLDVCDGVRGDARPRLSRGDDLRLSFDAGSRVADLERAVVVDRRAADHRMDAIAVGERVLQALEHHQTHAAPPDRAVRVGVEGAAAPGQRLDSSLRVRVGRHLGDPDRDATGNRHIALAAEQRLTGQVDRDQRGRASGLDIATRSPEAELVRHLGGQVVAIEANRHLVTAQRCEQVRAREQVVQ